MMFIILPIWFFSLNQSLSNFSNLFHKHTENENFKIRHHFFTFKWKNK
jgi:hypothetical protein